MGGFKDVAGDLGAAEGVWAVEDEEGDFCFGGGLHAEAEGADVGVEPGPDVLDIVDEDVEVFEVFLLGFLGLTIQAEDGDACFGVGFVTDFCASIGETAQTVFGAEEGGEFDFGVGV